MTWFDLIWMCLQGLSWCGGQQVTWSDLAVFPGTVLMWLGLT